MTSIVTPDAFEFSEYRLSIEIPMDAFTALLDSESHVTDCAAYRDGATTLCRKLEAAANISDVDYNGHFGNFVFYSIEPTVHTEEVVARIVSVINEHLEWCLSL